MDRLSDEANGYFVRIYHNMISANSLYNDRTKVKELKKLGKLLDAHEKVAVLDEVLDKLKEPRHKSAHPDAYFTNGEALRRGTEIHTAIKTSINALLSLNIVDDFSLKREERNQDNHLVQRLTYMNHKKDKHKSTKKNNLTPAY